MDYYTCLDHLNSSFSSSSNSSECDQLFLESVRSWLINGTNLEMCLNYSGPKEFGSIPELSDYIKLFACAVVIIGGLLGNISIILTIALNRAMRTSFNIYVTNLAVADTMICLMCMLPYAISVVAAKVYIFGKFMCKFQNFAEMTCLICSVITLSAMSCDRYFAIMFPIQARTAKQRTSLLLTVIWIISISVSIPLLFVKKLLVIQWLDFTETQCSEKWPIYWYIDETSEDCESYEPQRFIYYVIVLTSLYFLPVIIMIAAYSSILWRVWMTDIPGEQNAANFNAHSRTRKKVNKMVFFVLVAFITCWTPIQIIVIYSAFLRSDSTSTALPEWVVEIQWVSHFLAYTNSFINPIIYGGFNKKFRDGFFYVLKCGYKRGQFGIPGVTRLTFTSRFTSSRSRKSSKSQTGSKKTSHKSNKEMELMHPIANGDSYPTAGDARVVIEEIRE